MANGTRCLSMLGLGGLRAPPAGCIGARRDSAVPETDAFAQDDGVAESRSGGKRDSRRATRCSRSARRASRSGTAAVLGEGPGLAAAAPLNRAGHAVTLYE